MVTVTTHSAGGLRHLVQTTVALVPRLIPAPVEGDHDDLILHAPETLRGYRLYLERLAREQHCFPEAVAHLWDEEHRLLVEARAAASQQAAATGRTLVVHPDWDEEMAMSRRA